MGGSGARTLASMRRSAIAASLALTAVAFALAACGGGGNDDKTPARTATPGTATPAASATPAGDIRLISLDDVADVQTLIEDTGGTFEQQDVIYADVTGDGVEEAVVPISSDGTLGQLAFIVLTPDGDDRTRTLLSERPANTMGLDVTVEGEDVVTTEPVPGPDDPECCPSKLRVTTYAWDGTAFAQISQRTIDNPGGVVKPTATP